MSAASGTGAAGVSASGEGAEASTVRGTAASAVRGAWPREARTVIVHEVDSPDAVPWPFAILAESALVPVPLEFTPHEHPLHELVWVRGGTMTVRLDDRVITVPEGHGLWIPAGMVHAGRTTAGTHLFDALFDPQRSPVSFSEPVVVDVNPVLASLIGYLERTDVTGDARTRAEAVVFDVLVSSEQQLTLRVPRTERIGPIVSALLDDPTDVRSLRDWSGTIGLSERTIVRMFRAHTGLSFLQWRQTLRVHHALTLLGEGLSVGEVAALMGYAQPSTFIASFKRVMGTTPGTYPRSSLSETPYRLS